MSKVKIGNYVRFYYGKSSWLILKLEDIEKIRFIDMNSRERNNFHFVCIFNHSNNNLKRGDLVVLTESNGNNWMDENFDYLDEDDIVGYLL